MNTSRRAMAAVMAALCLWSVGAAGQQRRPGNDGIRCSFESVPYLPFGDYDPFQPNDLSVQNQFSYVCTEGSLRSRTNVVSSRRDQRRIQISISPGLSGDYDRRMRGYLDNVRYNIYLDPNCRQVWGDGSRGTDVYQKRVNAGDLETVPIFGRMPAGQNVNGGVYYDLLVVTIDF